jgi:hypothetical protein
MPLQPAAGSVAMATSSSKGMRVIPLCAITYSRRSNSCGLPGAFTTVMRRRSELSISTTLNKIILMPTTQLGYYGSPDETYVQFWNQSGDGFLAECIITRPAHRLRLLLLRPTNAPQLFGGLTADGQTTTPGLGQLATPAGRRRSTGPSGIALRSKSTSSSPRLNQGYDDVLSALAALARILSSQPSNWRSSRGAYTVLCDPW